MPSSACTSRSPGGERVLSGGTVPTLPHARRRPDTLGDRYDPQLTLHPLRRRRPDFLAGGRVLDRIRVSTFAGRVTPAPGDSSSRGAGTSNGGQGGRRWTAHLCPFL